MLRIIIKTFNVNTADTTTFHIPAPPKTYFYLHIFMQKSAQQEQPIMAVQSHVIAIQGAVKLS